MDIVESRFINQRPLGLVVFETTQARQTPRTRVSNNIYLMTPCLFAVFGRPAQARSIGNHILTTTTVRRPYEYSPPFLQRRLCKDLNPD
jgi:hypothetical protein